MESSNYHFYSFQKGSHQKSILKFTCSHHLRADAEGDGGPMDGDRQEELPHARVGLLQA